MVKVPYGYFEHYKKNGIKIILSQERIQESILKLYFKDVLGI
jgi:hypothetical protein